MAAGEIAAVVVVRLDRLSRRTRDVLTLVEDDFKARGVDLISVSEQLDTRTPSGMLMLTLLGALAQMERELIAERTRDALQQKRSRGERLGTTPLGFRTPGPGMPMEPEPQEAGTVLEILRRRRRGESYRAIARALEEGNLRSKRGGRWAAATVRGVWLRRARYRLSMPPA
jgi:DNA invertase Pin-like site-specific DNA recombinase